jgi:hypothetical protein
MTGLEVNVTDTASSDFGSALIHAKVDGVSALFLNKWGWMYLGNPGYAVTLQPYTDTLEIISESGATYATFNCGELNVSRGAAVTANEPAISASQTWNNAAVAFQGFALNITNTASAAASALIDLQIGGASKFSVDKAGYVNVGRGDTSAVDKGIEIYRYVSGSDAQRFFWGYQGDDGIFNYYKGGAGTLSQVKIQYDSSTLLRLRSDGVSIIAKASSTPANNGDLMFEATSNTTVTVKLKGTDGTVRSGTITLS